MKRLLVVLPLVFAVACGGSSSHSSSSQGLSKATYLAKAEALCDKANAEVKALSRPQTPAALVAYISKIVEIAGNATTSLEALQPPSADKADLQAKVLVPLRAQVREGLAYVTQVAAAVRANDQTKLGELVANPPTQTKADTAWMSSYGFKACVESAKTDN